MTSHDSETIRITRVLCIFFMMSVHVPPGPGAASFINVGNMSWLHVVWIDILGRASVAALSFISGYLLVISASRRSIFEMIRRRFSVLVVPMLLWNMFFVLLVVVVGFWGHESTAWERLINAAPAELISLLTGLLGPTLNQSLVFLRDMFVCSVLLLVLWRWIRAVPLPALALTFAFALFDGLDPLVLRPSILLFMVAGALSQDRGIALSQLADLRCSMPVGFICSILLAVLYLVSEHSPIGRELVNLILRTSLVFGCLAVASFFAKFSFGRVMARTSDSIFLVYLSHVPVLSVLWIGWQWLFGGPMQPAYLAFFLLAPLMAVFVGLALDSFLRELPGLRKAVSGRG